MIYIVIWTIPSEPKPHFIIVDKFEDLAGKVASIKSGKDATVKIYEAQDVNYKITYTDREEKTIKKIPNIEILN